MADPNAAPSIDPFAQLDSSAPLEALPSDARAKPTLVPAKPADPFAELDSSQPLTPPESTSATGAFARGAATGALPALGSLPTMAAGAELGAAAGAPLAPFTAGLSVPVLGFLGGAAGAIGGAALVAKAQDYALKAVPDSWRDKLGLSDRQQQLDESEHPVASFLGGVAPYALTMRPGGIAKTKLPENATALQRILANPATARVFGGAAMGGMQLGQEAVSDEGQGVNWNRVAVATGFGLVFNRPTRFGERITELGARPARTLLGRPHPVPEAAASPTLNEAADAKVLGPGVTEQVFQGAHAQDPSAEMTAQQAVRDEQAVMGTAPKPDADVHATARTLDPELFAHYDNLSAQRDVFRGWLAEGGIEEAPVAQKHLAAIEVELRTLEPEVQAAYRKAAERAEAPTIERPGAPERFPSFAAMLAAQGAEGAPAAPVGAEKPAAGLAAIPSAEVGVGASEGAPVQQPVPRSIEQQRDFISRDVTRQLTAAGRSADEAKQAGSLWAHFFETAARNFKGALGSPEASTGAKALISCAPVVVSQDR